MFFVNIVGAEGSGHHGIVPIIIKLLCDTNMCVKRHTWYDKLAFGDIRFGLTKYRGSIIDALNLCNKIHHRHVGSNFAFAAYSWPDGKMFKENRRNIHHNLYNLVRIQGIVEKCNISYRVIYLDRNVWHRINSAKARHFYGKTTQIGYDMKSYVHEHINFDKHITSEINKISKHKVFKISYEYMDLECMEIMNKLVQFFHVEQNNTKIQEICKQFKVSNRSIVLSPRETNVVRDLLA